MRTPLFVLAGLAILAGLWLVMKPAPQPAATAQGREVRDTRVFELDLAAAREPGADLTLRASQGEVVVLQITAARDDELHLHGYDLSLEVAAGQTAVMTVPADKAGRFELETHQDDAVVAVLEVLPRR